MSLKRERNISPPPNKRRKLSDAVPDIRNMSQIDVSKSSSALLCPSIRIFSWNVNGIAPFLQKSISSFFSPVSNTSNIKSSVGAVKVRNISPPRPTASIRSFLQRHRWPHAVLLQEVKINSQDERTKRAVQVAVNGRISTQDDGPDYVVHLTLPEDKSNVRGFGGKMYGVASIIRSDFYEKQIERVRTVEWDREGRVNIIETKDRTALFNIYAVNGTTNPYRSPASGKTIGTRHDRKLAFHRHLLDECQRLERDGWQLILAGDFNIARNRIDGHPNLREYPTQHVFNRADFNRKFFEDEEGLAGIDVFRYLKGDEKRYTYHPRGREWGSSCDRVDFIITSKSLVAEGRLVDADILDSAKERGPSDHVPIWVEVKPQLRPESAEQRKE
ncbi:DNase I-like protein [Patellaria atrata CBS 101060]|uniref:DNase I-like protein n=1 Tax=Patellaria atrata CBS 101060 TaxID=1346257 RepID=A0A9P4VVL4_9PEZI|nr:DNase I-like protein [Patellaria atrata CBS 101060]